MRAAVLIAPLVASCTMAPQPPAAPNPAGQAQLAQLLGGKVAQGSLDCLPHYDANDMRVIDANTIAFRDGPWRTYVTHTDGECAHLGEPSYAMVTKQVGGMGLCRGDIARVVDTGSRMTVGSCVIGPFVTYVTPGR